MRAHFAMTTSASTMATIETEVLLELFSEDSTDYCFTI